MEKNFDVNVKRKMNADEFVDMINDVFDEGGGEIFSNFDSIVITLQQFQLEAHNAIPCNEELCIEVKPFGGERLSVYCYVDQGGKRHKETLTYTNKINEIPKIAAEYVSKLNLVEPQPESAKTEPIVETKEEVNVEDLDW